MDFNAKNVFVLDNGACYAKIGKSSDKNPLIVPNCIMKAKSEKRRPFIGNQINECRDVSGLFYILSFQKGYILNWDIQKTVWDYMFSQECFPVNFSENPVIVTEPIFNFPNCQEALIEIFFEEYECCALAKTTVPDLCQYNYTNNAAKKPLCCLVIDMGFSFTHIVPFIKGKRVKDAIKRIDVGGKVLTNHLKEIISYRQLNVMDEAYVINQMKEDTCYVATNFDEEMKKAKRKVAGNSIIKEYVLPDFTTIKRGRVRNPEPENKNDDYQILRMNNERFSIPEILFHPSDIGIAQMGVSEAVIESVNACPEETRPHLFANIIVIGGCAKFAGMQQRLQKDIRSMAPDLFDVCVNVPDDPISYGWKGGKFMSADSNFQNSCISRQEYEEMGCRNLVEKLIEEEEKNETA